MGRSKENLGESDDSGLYWCFVYIRGRRFVVFEGDEFIGR